MQNNTEIKEFIPPEDASLCKNAILTAATTTRVHRRFVQNLDPAWGAGRETNWENVERVRHCHLGQGFNGFKTVQMQVLKGVDVEEY